MANNVLYSWALIEFAVQPMNVNEVDHHTGSDYARKDVMESSPRREWTGEKDEEIEMRGKIFPLMIGGFANLESFETARRAAQAHPLIRGGASFAQVLGWYICEDLRRGHSFLLPNGIGRVVTFQARFVRVDIPRPASYFLDIFRMTQST